MRILVYACSIMEDELKLKPIITFDCAEIRERDWCNVVTCHVDTAQGYVWRIQNFVLGEHVLRPCPENPTPVKVRTISASDNFAILGTTGRRIERFNLQSGFSRGSYLDMSERSNCTHDEEVFGVACDATNTLMISSSYHGDMKNTGMGFQRKLKSRWKVDCSLVKIVYHRPNGSHSSCPPPSSSSSSPYFLLATVVNDLVIRMFDVMALRTVCKFEGHTDRITDLCFSEDGKWLLSSSMDGTLRIWDMILARQWDAIHVDVAITSLSLSPNMDVLATTHVDQLGVNEVDFSFWFAQGLDATNKTLLTVFLTQCQFFEGMQDMEQLANVQGLSADQNTLNKLMALHPGINYRVSNNHHMVRNKPIQAPKKPERALPSIPSLSREILFKPSEPVKDEKDNKAEEVENNKKKVDALTTQFLQFLQSSAEMNNFSTFTDYLKGLSPSTLDMELRMLQIIKEDDLQEVEKRPEFASIELLMDYFIHEISARKLSDTQCGVWERIDEMFQSARCMLTFLSNSQF
ncbi:hypothetical protein K2173_008102 [Erythroxylum novogranatense]|uniref:WDR36/Utp21 C-terminal domain-containing protein n=1 Tax=Erythroxylum novogranatense TaxID=1862640 RepID=A0AAV8S8X8_9ROSI|nr:hypothetical protein K2173_008102 [Erythroxylum novogranatense]